MLSNVSPKLRHTLKSQIPKNSLLQGSQWKGQGSLCYKNITS